MYQDRFSAWPISDFGELLLHVEMVRLDMEDFLRRKRVHRRLPDTPVKDPFIDQLNFIWKNARSLFVVTTRGFVLRPSSGFNVVYFPDC